MTTIASTVMAAGVQPDLYVVQIGDVGLLPSRPSIFLSASVPYEFDESNVDLDPGEDLQELNARFWAARQPARVRAAVSALTRTAINHGFRLIFGAHPSISPMVLQAASDMQAPPGSIVIFQSDRYAKQLPQPTLELAKWAAGTLVMTAPRVEAPGKRRFPNSLAFMRDAMVNVGGLRAAVFVGGMKGIGLEADAFRARLQGAPCYAIESTGSAAAELAARPGGGFHGTLKPADADLLRTSRSYSLVSHKIMMDLRQAGQP